MTVSYKDIADVERRLTIWLVEKLEGKASVEELRRLANELKELRENAVSRTGPLIEELNALIRRVEVIDATRHEWIGEHTTSKWFLAFIGATALAMFAAAVTLLVHYL